MTAEERADLQIAIDLIRDLSAKVDSLPAQWEETIEKRMTLHLARAHSRDAEIVGDVLRLMDDRKMHGAFRQFCSRYWHYIVVALGVVAVVLEVLERTHVI